MQALRTKSRGKAYTMKELKQIVDYLTQNKLYNEVRGRKMWQDFADSGMVDRSWQSLKETFLKRILPDIHNPYYGLTVIQISSFRQEQDIDNRNKNKLEITTVSGNSSSSEDNKKISDQPSTSKKCEDQTSGEDVRCSKIQKHNRDSTETLVLDQFEVSDKNDSESDSGRNKVKSLKDLIIYEEPLTPMLQEVLDDFATDEDEPALQIVEEPERSPTPTATKQETAVSSPKNDAYEPVKTSNTGTENGIVNGQDAETDLMKAPPKIKSLKLKKSPKSTWEIKNQNTETDKEKKATENVTVNGNKESEVNTENKMAEPKTVNVTSSIDNCSLSTTDSVLPNNQEGLPINSVSPSQRTSDASSTSDQQPNSKKKGNKKKNNTKDNTEPKRKIRRQREKSNESTSKEKSTGDSLEVVPTIEINDTESQNIDQDKEITEINLVTQDTLSEKNKDVARKSDIIENTPDQSSNVNENIQAGPSGIKNKETEENPCLKSVSLYAEQFSTSKYSDSDSDMEVTSTKNNTEVASPDKGVRGNVEGNEEKQTRTGLKDTEVKSDCNKNEDKRHGLKDVVLLKSHSESDSDDFEPPKKKVLGSKTVPKVLREKAIENILGFSSGTHSKRKTNSRDVRIGAKARTFNRRVLNSSQSRNSQTENNHGSDTSDYSTMSEDEHCTRAQGSRHRKYVKPNSYKVRSFPGDHGLFFMDGNKIYPVFRHRKNTKEFIKYYPEDDSDEDESHWKKMYLEEKQKAFEEKIRADELARLLHLNERKIQCKEKNVSLSPKESTAMQTIEEKSNAPSTVVSNCGENAESKPDKRVKIKITKDQEIELECQWPEVHPVLEKVARLFHKHAEPKAEQAKPEIAEVKPNAESDENAASKPKTEETDKSSKPVVENGQEDNVVISSGKSTPLPRSIDPDVHEKVNKIESEIFKEIEEKDKSENEVRDDNVTKRKRGRPKNTISPIEPELVEGEVEGKVENDVAILEAKPKKTSSRISVKDKKSKESNVSRVTEQGDVDDAVSVRSRRRVKPAKMLETDEEVKPKKSRSTTRVQETKKSESKLNVEIPEDDSQVRYKFPNEAQEKARGRPRTRDNPSVS